MCTMALNNWKFVDYFDEFCNWPWDINIDYIKKIEHLQGMMYVSRADNNNVINQPWYPANVAHLCLHIQHYDDLEVEIHLWHVLDSKMFPKLKQLHVTGGWTRNIKERLFQRKTANLNNIKSLLQNKLESLCINISNVPPEIIFLLFRAKPVSYFLNVVQDIFCDGDDKSIYSDEFVMKLGLVIDFRNKNNYQSKVKIKQDSLISIIDKINEIFGNMCDCFDRTLFGFKIEFANCCKPILDNIHSLVNGVANNKKLSKKNKWKCIFSVSRVPDHLSFAMIFTRQTEKCWMDPKYEYTCSYCASQPWSTLEID